MTWKAGKEGKEGKEGSRGWYTLFRVPATYQTSPKHRRGWQIVKQTYADTGICQRLRASFLPRGS
ncbi:hypothetical protein IG631_15023 [Alternaria alternata]|nr:hypothetical protein IG631_15023 [Alternaria alternata]